MENCMNALFVFVLIPVWTCYQEDMFILFSMFYPFVFFSAKLVCCQVCVIVKKQYKLYVQRRMPELLSVLELITFILFLPSFNGKPTEFHLPFILYLALLSLRLLWLKHQLLPFCEWFQQDLLIHLNDELNSLFIHVISPSRKSIVTLSLSEAFILWIW